MKADLHKALQALDHRGPDAMERALALIQQTAFFFSMKVCGHREDAEDTAQETMLRAARELRKISSPKALAVWLYKVARSRCLMSRRRSKFAPKQELSLDAVLPDRDALLAMLASPADASPERQLLRKESRRELQAAVERIPPDYRMILVLHDMEELDTAEISAVTRLRPGTVRVRLHRARAFLRNELAKTPRQRRRCSVSRECKQLFSALSDYLDNELDPTRVAAIEKHLDDCKPCVAYLATLEETVRRCKRHCPPAVGAKLTRQVREAVKRLAAASRA